MSQVLVTFESIGQAAQDCDKTNSDFRGRLSDLQTYLAPMISTWTGRASEDYQALQKQWNTSADDLSTILQQIAQALRIAQDNYTRTEQSNASVWHG